MSSLIEKAALRLEQLRQAGVDVSPDDEGTAQAAAREASQASARAAHQAPRSAAATPFAQRAPVNSHISGQSHRAFAATDADIVSRQVQLDLPGLLARGYVTPHASRTELAEQFRVIKRPLIANAAGRGASVVPNGNRIMVTSAMPGEGKSFTALNLAMSIAMELDYHVLLVDADVARPSLMQVLGLSQGPGLLDLMVKPGMAMSDAMLRTNVDKLSLLPSGTPHPRATELLASDAMEQLLDEMGQRYPDRLIIFDSPPLLPTTESRVLASHMGQIVLVVQAGKTLQSEVDQALLTIEECPVKLLVLNQATGAQPSGYGYGPSMAAGPSRVASPA
jgi:protein-tyrosine kinase